ncbi:thioredoxin family protein [Flavobacteriaceae bacterium 3-367]
MEKSGQTTMERTAAEIISESLPKAIGYGMYREMVHQLASEGKTTGPDQTASLVNYTQLNNRRLKRWDKTLRLSEEQKAQITLSEKKMTWLVLTESWCGDAAPSMPVMNRIAELNPNIDFKILLRDENLELMHRFKTKGALSIPKLIALDTESGEVIADWGPRSVGATKMVEAYKKEHGTLSPEFKEDLQLWYNSDKGQDILKDLLELLALK